MNIKEKELGIINLCIGIGGGTFFKVGGHKVHVKKYRKICGLD